MRLRTLVRDLDQMLRKRVEVPRIRQGSSQILETLINEDVPLLAKHHFFYYILKIRYLFAYIIY
jgi:hypothetical protein